MRRTFLLSALLLSVTTSGWADKPLRANGHLDTAVFDSEPAEMAPDIFGDRQKKGGVLRVLTVDERVGQARSHELVRVPVFFHAGECADPQALQIVPLGGGAPVPYQPDDIRRDAAGHVARMHLYFEVEQLPAWGRRQFQLVPGANPGAKLAALPLAEKDGLLTIGGDEMKVTFQTKGDYAGAIVGLQSPAGHVTVPEGHLAPAAMIIRQENAGGKTLKENAFTYQEPDSLIVKNLTWASGPLLAKVRLRVAPRVAPADIAEYTYLIPRHGSEFTQMERLYAEERETPQVVGAKANALLAGKLLLGAAPGDQQVLALPAGLRRETRSVFGQTNDVLVNTKAGVSLSMVPYVQTGATGIGVEADGQTSFRGASTFQTNPGSNSSALRIWWGQVRFLLSTATEPEALWEQQVKAFQPLTAVVDEPWAKVEDVWNFAREVNREYWKIQNWGRSFEANLVMGYLDGRDVAKMLEGGPASEERPDLRSYLPTQEAVEAAWKKTQGAGAVDPYNLTYSSSAVVPFSALLQPSHKLDGLAWSLGQASRLANRHETPEGWPNVRTFANTANMKIGTYLCALWGGQKLNDPDLVRWARDAALAQNLTAPYGHGQRPYDMSVGGKGVSDVLYISVTDYWLRAMELLGQEDLSIHPSVYGRYFDMVDVNADLYQRKFDQNKETKEWSKISRPTWWRATFLRGQAHDHRWEGYGCDPYLGLLGRATDGGSVGVTETCYYLQKEIGRPQSWQNLMTNVFFPAVMTTKSLAGYRPAARPVLPENVKVAASGGKNTVTWSPVPGAAGYRIYRAKQAGGPWTWVNSPYPATAAVAMPTAADKAAAQTAAAALDEAKAKASGVDVKKLKLADRTPFVSQMPKVAVPGLPARLIQGTSFTDADGSAGAHYFVTAEDAAGRESRWQPAEPVPVAAGGAGGAGKLSL